MGVIATRLFVSHPVAAAQYVRLVSAEKDLRLAGEGNNFAVGVFDGELSSLEATLTVVRLKFPSMRALLLSFPSDEEACLRWAIRGVWGLVPYERYEQDLPRAIRQLAAGQLWFPPAVVTRWMQLDTARRESALRLPLTRREREVMEFLTRRLSNKEIAGILRISERTVKFHVGNILNKLHVSSRQELSAMWLPHPRLATAARGA
jgi:DNA-binding NarL/FixJ family response regulator